MEDEEEAVILGVGTHFFVLSNSKEGNSSPSRKFLPSFD
jgi:hypothetical protein